MAAGRKCPGTDAQRESLGIEEPDRTIAAFETSAAEAAHLIGGSKPNGKSGSHMIRFDNFPFW